MTTIPPSSPARVVHHATELTARGRKRTKVVATLGPACDDEAVLREMYHAGMNVARFNMSHGDHRHHSERLDLVRRLSVEMDRPVAILVDLQGPKIRVGRFTGGSAEWPTGHRTVITTEELEEGDADRVGCTYDGLHLDVKSGSTILVDDGRLRLSVERVDGRDVHCTIEHGGTVKDNKGINLPGVDVSAPSLTDKDKEDLAWALTNEADYLAQVSQVGGGSSVEKVRPQAPISNDIPKPERGEAPQPVAPSIPQPQEQTPPEVLTQETATAQVVRQETKKPKPELKKPNARELIQRSMELARLEAEIGRDLEAYARRPRRKFISANTKEYEFATYMQAWVSKVERIGNLNYPDEARRNSLAGSLVLTVAINRDGSVDAIDIIQPSGFPVLDDAAVRIVRLGEPYAALPEEIRSKVDILHITRTWQFLPGNVLRHK